VAQPRKATRRRQYGKGRVWQRGKVWHIAWHEDGVEFRESAHTTDEFVARQRLREKLEAAEHGPHMLSKKHQNMNTAQKLKQAPREVQAAVTAAEREIHSLACEIERLQERIGKLQGFIESCRVFDGIEEATQGATYAEVAMNLLAAAKRPMSTGQLVEAMATAGRPVNGASRKHRLTTLNISLNRAPSLHQTRNGRWWLRGIPIPSESGHGS
jgi:DNA-binding response OmpR family regulator